MLIFSYFKLNLTRNKTILNLFQVLILNSSKNWGKKLEIEIVENKWEKNSGNTAKKPNKNWFSNK